jgi:endonuclease/exonuclease/phosphatase (EEP) superfamily protein YafD
LSSFKTRWAGFVRGVWPGRIALGASWAYALVVLIVLVLIRNAGESWWLASLLLFAPRWPWLLPIPVLTLLAWRVKRRRLWAIHATTALVVAGPLMGLNLPLGHWFSGRAQGTRLRIMTLNRGSGRLDRKALADLIRSERIDVICFQEVPFDLKLEPEFARGWHRTRNGAVLSRFPIIAEEEPIDTTFPEYGFWAVRYTGARIRLDTNEVISVASVHMPSMRLAFGALRRGQTDVFDRFVAWRWGQVGALAEALISVDEVPALVAGDFNCPRDSALLDPLRTRFQLAFETAGFGYGWTFSGGHPWIGIDHILAGPEWSVARCSVGPEVGSDHRPMVAELVLNRR